MLPRYTIGSTCVAESEIAKVVRAEFRGFVGGYTDYFESYGSIHRLDHGLVRVQTYLQGLADYNPQAMGPLVERLRQAISAEYVDLAA